MHLTDEQRMARFIYHMTQATRYTHNPETKRTLRNILHGTPWEKRIIVGSGEGPIINIRLIDDRIRNVTSADPIPVNIKRVLSKGKDFGKILLELKARREPCLLMVT